jgi:hypothetical protein
MKECKLTLVNWFTKEETEKTIIPKDPLVAANIHQKNNPECNVLLEWHDQGEYKFTTKRPYNMELDLMKVEDEEDPTMTMDQFTKKWYGKISKSKLKEIEKELISEFKTEEDENI